MRKKQVIRVGAIGAVLLMLLAVLTYTTFFAAAQGGTRIQYGDQVTGNIDAIAAIERWTFEGLRGDIVTVHVERTGGQLIPSIMLDDPDGEMLITLVAQPGVIPAVEVTVSLQSSGLHTLTVGSDGRSTGTYQLDLALLEGGPAPAGDEGVLVYGRPGIAAINDATFREFWSFQGMRGDVVDVHMNALSGDLDAYVSLVSPQGDVLASSDSGGQGLDAAIYAVQLPSSGTYSVVARRAGPNFGEGGTTAGDYEIIVTLRTPGEIGGTRTPTVLALERVMRGRLNADAPTVLYSVTSSGVLALRLDIAEPAQLGTFTVMTPAGASLGTFTGVTPLQASVVLPNEGEYWIEVSAANIRADEPVDFGLLVTPLRVAAQTAHPLIYGHPQIIRSHGAAHDAWYFAGRAGDLIALTLEPFGQALTGKFTVTAPGGAPLVERSLEGKTIQSLLLSADGIYEISVEPDPLGTGYSIEVAQQGLAGVSFVQHTLPLAETALPVGVTNPATGALDGYATAGWYVDVAEPETWRFVLSATNNQHPIAIALETPEGSLLGHAVTDDLTRTARLQAHFPRAGRYRVLVLNLHMNDITAYTLTGFPAEGGMLAEGGVNKGVLTPDLPYDVWALEAAPDSLINIDLALITPSSPPNIYVVGPDGLLVASIIGDGTSLVGVPTTDGGTFRVIVQQLATNPRLVYTITSNVIAPFDNVALTPPVEGEVPVVFVVDVTPTPQIITVSATNLITPALTADAPVLTAARRIEMETLIRGEIEPVERFQAWRFTANTDQLLGFHAIALDDTSGPDLIIHDEDGQVVVEKYVADVTSNTLMHRFVRGGTYTIAIKLDGGGRYTLWIDVFNRIDEQVATVIPGKTITYGQTQLDQLTTRAETRSFLFFGHVGDVISARAVAQEYKQDLRLVLTAPDGGTLDDRVGDNSHVTITDITLMAEGIYQLDVRHATVGGNDNNAAGPIAVHLDLQEGQPLQRGGGVLDTARNTVLTANTTHHWLFEAQAGERVTVRIDPLNPGAPTPLVLELADSAGRVFLRQESQLGQGALLLEDVLLPRAGVYLALVSGAQQAGGAYRISLTRDLRSTRDAERAIRYGETVGKVLAAPNFLDAWTFAGSRGDVITLAARPVRGDVPPLSLQLRTGEGYEVVTMFGDATRNGVRVENVTLPVTGHYSIVVGNMDAAFDGATAYELTLLLRDSPARSASTVLAYGDRVRGTFFIDDPSDVWVFEGQQGDMVAAVLTTQTPGLQPTLTLLATDWRAAAAAEVKQLQVLGSTQIAEDATVTQLDFVLPLDGTYALMVQDTALQGGTYELHLINQNDTVVPATLVRLGQLRNGQIAPGDLYDSWRFTGTTGATVTIRVTPDRRMNLSPRITLFSPDGVPLVRATAGMGDEAVITDFQLPVGGSYVVQVMPARGRTEGRYSILVQEAAVPDVAGYADLPYETVQFGTLDEVIPIDWWAFDGQAGNVVRIRAEATSGDLDIALRVYGIDDALLGMNDDAGNLDAEIYITLPADGRYAVEVRRYHGVQGITAGNYALNLDLAYQAAAPDAVMNANALMIIAYGDRVVGTTDSNNRSAFWSFEGMQGDIIQAKLQFAVDDAPLTLTLRDPAGNALVTGMRERGDVLLDGFTLPVDGTYILDVRRPGDAVARYSPYTLDLALTGMLVPPTASGGPIQIGGAVTSQFWESAAIHTWLFGGQAAEMVAVSIVTLSGTLNGHLELRAPDGSLIYTTPITTNTTGRATGRIELPLSGVYSLVVRAEHTVPGAVYRVRLQRVEYEVATQVLTFDVHGLGMLGDTRPREQWQFGGEAGESISVRVSRMSGNLIPVVMLYGPDGHPLSRGRAVGDVQAVISRFVLPFTGDYTIVVARAGDVAGTTAGTYQVILNQHAISAYAAEAQTIVFGEPIGAFIDHTAPQVYAFDAIAGDVVALSARLVDGDKAPTLHVETESGIVFDLPLMIQPKETGIATLEIPRTGRYVVVVEAAGPAHYEMVVHRRPQTPNDEAIVRVLGRDQTLVSGVEDAAVPTYWRFTGERGDVLNFTIDTTGGGLRADVTLFGPNGFVANNVEVLEDRGAVVLGPVRLPENGPYILLVAPWLGTVGGSTGRFSVLMEMADPGESGSVGGHILMYGGTVNGGLIANDNVDNWTFDGAAGEVIAVRAEYAQTTGVLYMVLRDPEGQVVAEGTPAIAYLGVEITDIELPAAGTYTVELRGQLTGNASIEYRFTVLTLRSPIITTIEHAQGISYGDTVLGTLSGRETYTAWVFYGTAGDQIWSNVTNMDAAFAPVVYLVGPHGNILRADAAHTAGAEAMLGDYVLETTGFYGLVVGSSPATTTQGPFDYGLTLAYVPSGAFDQGLLTTGMPGVQAVLSTLVPVHQWQLRPDHAGTYLVQVQSFTAGIEPTLTVQTADGVVLATGTADVQGQIAIMRLEAGTQYIVLVSGGLNPVAAHYAIEIIPASALRDGGLLDVGQPEVGRITHAQFSDEWQFVGVGGQTVNVTVNRIAGDLTPVISLYGPNGLLLREAQPDLEGTATMTVELPGDGTYRIIVARANLAAGTTTGDYGIIVDTQ